MCSGSFRVCDINRVGNRRGNAVLNGHYSEFLEQVAVCGILVQRKSKGCGAVRSLGNLDALCTGFIRILCIEVQYAVLGSDGGCACYDHLVSLNDSRV